MIPGAADAAVHHGTSRAASHRLPAPSVACHASNRVRQDSNGSVSGWRGSPLSEYAIPSISHLGRVATATLPSASACRMWISSCARK